MTEIILSVSLESAGCFSIGEGTPGEVDIEIQHDENGFPFLSGKALKGLLHEEAAELAFALNYAGSTKDWRAVSDRVFGAPGSTISEQGLVKVSDLQLPADFRERINKAIQRKDIRASQVLRLLTSKRTQTAVDESGAPMPETLRTLRIIPRETTFFGSVFYEDLDKDQEVFLYGCLRALRRAGSNKSRGLGRLCINFRQEKDFSEEDF
ncbi:MAG: hypothetical protein KBB13_08050 [Anaerolineaceae bacterium]|jgi:hypothetical protein|nr:hypothetical protein [Anaerolineaceae bacterium]